MKSKGKLQLCFLCVWLVLLAGCSSASKHALAPEASKDYMYAVTESTDVAYENEDGTDVALPQARKVIVNGSMTMRTDSFDETVSAIEQLVTERGGYIQDARRQTYAPGKSTYDAVLRFPAEVYDAARQDIQMMGVLQGYNQQTEDATDQYTDLAGRLQVKTVEESRLLGLIQAAEENPDTPVETILALEERLGQVREEMALMEAHMTAINRQSAYATLSLHLMESPMPFQTAEGLGENMQGAFMASALLMAKLFQGVAVFIAGALVPVGVLAVAMLAVRFVMIQVRKRMKQNK